ncbi:MAG: FAD-binding domain-containing protein [Verrucomicrobiota bacterium]
MFLPDRSSALGVLHDFLPRAGKEYAAQRNYDNGPDQKTGVSKLSPWIRIRMLSEWEIVSEVLAMHTASSASKFIDEVCWRTYWKGWLQLRPSVWISYLGSRERYLEDFQSNIQYREAIDGRTGIDCFDAWAVELVDTGFLHNHARMWFASIWIHTLKLPWELGADWFLRHLLDGDPASNTLSWRWVAGLHTQGKSYLARADNIRKYTNNRFDVNAGLAKEPIEFDPYSHPSAQAISELPPIPSKTRLGLIVIDEDLNSLEWLGEGEAFEAKAGFFPLSSYNSQCISEKVVDFRRQAMANCVNGPILENVEDLSAWIIQERLQGVVLAEPTTGLWDSIRPELEAVLKKHSVSLYYARHWWDELFFPRATRGFFNFKKAIPKALEQLERTSEMTVH